MIFHDFVRIIYEGHYHRGVSSFYLYVTDYIERTKVTNKTRNIEVQKSDDCNHVKRVRYNASVITAHNSEPGDEFDDVQNLCMIYISKRDVFQKKELDDKDKEMFPNTYEKFNSLKHDKEEVSKMCDKVEAYAKKEKIYSAIEIYVEECSFTKEQIIPKLTKRFNITKEDAESYYDDVFAVK